MRCSLDKVLLDARQLANRIRATDETADVLIKQASEAHNRVIAKKQCQEEIMSFEDLNQISKSRPRNRLMMCIAAENKQLELLKQENKVLRTSLSEYETTFEMIMRKFRKHKHIMKKLEQLERSGGNPLPCHSNSHVQSGTADTVNSEHFIIDLCWKITKLQKAIEQALVIDNRTTNDLSEIETRLLFENQELRRLIEINEEFKNDLQRSNSVVNAVVVHSNNSNADEYKSRQNFVAASQPQSISACGNRIKPASTQSLSEESISNPGLTIVNGSFLKESKKSRSISSNSNGNNRFIAVSNHHPVMKNSIENCRSISDDDDDHSSVASDASVKTLIHNID